jgi:hypothetical protein
MFEVGRVYSRSEIRTLTGSGTTQAYLLSAGGRIVAGCFDPRLNPLAPAEVYVAHGPIRESSARRAVAQNRAISVFTKVEAGAFGYEGEYRPVAYRDDPEAIAEAERRAPWRRGDVAGVLMLVRVP